MKPQDPLDDAPAIRRAKEGDMDAFESLVRRYQQPIYALCRRLTGAHQAADDIAQDTFIRAYLNLSAFEDGRPLFPWLRRIALNGALNHLKARRRERPLAGEDRPPDRAGAPAPADPTLDGIVRAEFDARFRQALESLPGDQKSVFVLRFHEGLSYAEIAAALDIPGGTVMSRLNRARRRLKLLLAGFIEEAAR